MRWLIAFAIFPVAFFSAALVPVQAGPPGPAVPPSLPFGTWAWDLHKLDSDLVGLVKATYSARELKLVLEFRRNLSFLDLEWSGPQGLRVLVDSYGYALQVRVSPPDIMTGRPPFLF